VKLNNIDRQQLIDLITSFHRVSALVVGDVCLDRYIFGEPIRLSREAPVPVLEWRREYALPGAASNPALNLASLGAQVSLVGVVGDDSAAVELRELLDKHGVDSSHLVSSPERRTTEKTRILAEGLLSLPQQVARVDKVDREPLRSHQISDLNKNIKNKASEADVILVSDYRVGVVNPEVISSCLEASQYLDIPILVDSQGELSRFKGYKCIRCNRREAERSLGHKLETEADFEYVLPQAAKYLECDWLVVTRDSNGISAYSQDTGYVHVPGEKVTVVDVVGAGDTVIAVLALVMALGGDVATASFLANKAASLVVQKLGNACVSQHDLLQSLR